VEGFWIDYLSGKKCRFAYGPGVAISTCFSIIQIGFTFLIPAHLDTTTTTTTRTILRLSGICLWLPGWASTRKVKPGW